MKRKNIHLARKLRKEQTPQERKLWKLLRDRSFGFKFRRQHSIGDYIADFCCIEKKLIVELDGGQHNEEKTIKKDSIREKYLFENGYKILRFWNNELDNNIEGVYGKIMEFLN